MIVCVLGMKHLHSQSKLDTSSIWGFGLRRLLFTMEFVPMQVYGIDHIGDLQAEGFVSVTGVVSCNKDKWSSTRVSKRNFQMHGMWWDYKECWTTIQVY
jgi:hypothetical protein